MKDLSQDKLKINCVAGGKGPILMNRRITQHHFSCNSELVQCKHTRGSELHIKNTILRVVDHSFFFCELYSTTLTLTTYTLTPINTQTLTPINTHACYEYLRTLNQQILEKRRRLAIDENATYH